VDDVAGAAGARDAAALLDEALQDALAVQGELGLRALGLLCDARRLLDEPQGWERPYETVVANCRGAMDSLLELSGLHPVGLKSAATDVLLRARALLEEGASGAADRDAQVLARTSLSEALEVLAGEVGNPGGYHSRRVRHVTERLTRRILGVAEESAARVWSDLYARASGVLHGSAVTAAQARLIFEDLVRAAAQVFVALPERAERVKELAGLSQPSAVDASEVAGWVDPRATEYFFVAATSPRWLDLLSAPQLLPEQARWPAWPYLERLAADDPDLPAGWLRDNFPAIQDIGSGALAQALRLAGRLGIRMAAQVQVVVTDDTIPGLLQMAVFWALDVPLADRDRSWILVVERLIDQVDRPTRDAAGNAGGPQGDRGLEPWDGGQLLTELVRTAYPAGQASDDIVLLRTVCAGLLGRYLGRPHHGFDLHLIGSEQDLSHVGAEGSRHPFVLVLARAVLDLALADARAGVPLATRTRPLARKVAVQGARDRVLATHLMETAPGPATGHQEEHRWWACALDVAERVVTGPMAHPDQVDLVALLVDRCPDEHRPALEAALASALGTPPDTAALDQGRSQWQTTRSVPQEWSRLWSWAALLPPAVLQPWQPTLTILQDLADGPAPDPRAPRDLLPWPADDPERLALSDLARTAADDGPPAAAHRIAAASAATRPGHMPGRSNNWWRSTLWPGPVMPKRSWRSSPTPPNAGPASTAWRSPCVPEPR
jgi:hypothetical protein